MPMIIESIDAIARQQQRDVLFVEFHPLADEDKDCQYEYPDGRDYDYQFDSKRQAFLSWLNEHGIAWCCCLPVASEEGFEAYQGQVYFVDLAMDESNPVYCRLKNHLEFEDGLFRDENLRFCYLPLDRARQNAHHDEPGFWEQWAKDF